MSVEVVETIYLRCDGVSYPGIRCSRTYGQMAAVPADSAGLAGMAERANSTGWQVVVRSEGLLGWTADVRCPKHRRPPSDVQPTPTTTEGEKP